MLSKNTIKFIKSLQIKKFRDSERLFIVEGKKSVLELINSDLAIVHIYTTQTFQHELIPFKHLQSKTEVVTIHELESVSRIDSNNTMLAVAKMREPNHFTYKACDKVLILDQVQDPGNLGTIIRTADWFGIETIVCSANTADFYNPKVIAATMGAFARINISYTDLPSEIAILKNQGFTIYGALLQGQNLTTIVPATKFAIVIGNESNGINPKITPLIDVAAKIAGFGMSESLNAAVAAGIIIHHFSR